MKCKASEKPLTENTITQNDEGHLESSLLKKAAKNIEPCEGYPYCDDTSGYPNDEINELLSSHLQQEYFKDVLSDHTEKACIETSEATAGNFISK